MTLGWLQKITADHYVISANGENSNPDRDTIEWICEARQGQPYSLYLTNEDMTDPKKDLDVGAEVRAAFQANPNPRRKVVYRGADDLSVKAELGDPIAY